MPRNKPKVSTKYKSSIKKENEVIKILKSKPEGITPKSISSLSSINSNTIKSILRKMEIDGRVKKKIRGYYLLVDNFTHEALLFKSQNLMLTYKSQDIDIDERVFIRKRTDYINYTLEIGKKSKQITMRVGSDVPFNISAIHIVGTLFQEWSEKYSGKIPSFKEIIVNTFEINRDYPNFKIEGSNIITLNSMTNLFKLYNKKNCVREEYKIKVPISLEFIVNLLQNGSISAENMAISKNNRDDINELRKNQIKLLSRIDKLQRWMFKNG